jgi:hypothetical protein
MQSASKSMSFPRKTRHILAFWSVCTIVCTAGLHGNAWATPRNASPASQNENTAQTIAFGGSLLVETALGRGVFISDTVTQRPHMNLLLSLRPKLTLLPAYDLSLRVRLDMDVNLLENYDSDRIAPHEPRLGDLQLAVSAGELFSLKPLNTTMNAIFWLSFPTSKESRFLTKVMGLHLETGVSIEPISWLSVSYTFHVTRNFHRYNVPLLDPSAFGRPPAARSGGAEQLAGGILVQGQAVTGWLLSNGLDVTFTPLKGLDILLTWGIVNAFRATSYPADDALASPHAVGGPGRNDIMWGGIEVAYQVHDYFGVALGSWTEQAPKTADNQSFRFPFWDTTSGAANRQVFYVSLTGSMPDVP